MKRFEFIVLTVAMIALGCAKQVVSSDESRDSILAVTSGETPPATQPAMPAGHPALPAGHPALPAGHPAIAQDGSTPTASVKTTTQEPDWIVHMRHIMVQPTDKGLRVIDMLAVENPDEAAWIGNTDATGNRTTFSLALPAGATDVQLDEGFDPASAIKDGKVINRGALQPGASQYRLQYTVPLNKGQAEISVVAPAPVSTLMIFYPDDGTTISGTGIQGPQTVDMGNGKTRYFKADDINVGHEVKLLVGGAPAVKTESSAAPASTVPGATELAKTIAGVGALLIFLLGGALMFMKPQTGRTNSKHR
jgi:hypothetical protein